MTKTSASGTAFHERLDRAERAVLLATTFLFPLVILPGITLDEFRLPKIAVLLFGIGLASGLRIASRTLGGPCFRWRALAFPLIALMMPLMLSWLSSPYKYWSLWGLHLRYQGLIPYALFALYGLLMADAFTGRKRQVAWALASAGAFTGAYALLQSLQLDPIFAYTSTAGVMSAPSTLANPNFSGGFQAMVLPVSIWLLLSEKGRAKDGAIAATSLSACGLLLSFSQGPWIAFVVGALGSAALYLWLNHKGLAAVLLIVALGLGSAGPFAVAATIVSPKARTVVGETVQVRGYGWQTALAAWRDAPLVGKGPNTLALTGFRHIPVAESSTIDNQSYLDEPHSIPLSFLASVGLLGAIGWLAAVLWVFVTATRRALADRAALSLAAFAGVTVYLGLSMVSIDDPIFRLTFWGLAAMSVASREHAGTVRSSERVLPLRSIALSLSLLVVLGATFGAARLLVADAEARTGNEAALNNDPEEAVRAFQRAIHLRGDAAYRSLAARRLGELATRRGAGATDLFLRMERLYDSVDHLEDPRWIMQRGLLTYTWSVRVDPRVRDRALDLVRRATILYPSSVDTAIAAAQVLLDVGEADEAAAILHRFVPHDPPFARFWGALALAEAHLGNERQARSYASRALEIDPDDGLARSALESLTR